MWELNGGLFLLPCNVKPKPTEKSVQAHENDCRNNPWFGPSSTCLASSRAITGLGESLFVLI